MKRLFSLWIKFVNKTRRECASFELNVFMCVRLLTLYDVHREYIYKDIRIYTSCSSSKSSQTSTRQLYSCVYIDISYRNRTIFFSFVEFLFLRVFLLVARPTSQLNSCTSSYTHCRTLTILHYHNTHMIALRIFVLCSLTFSIHHIIY